MTIAIQMSRIASAAFIVAFVFDKAMSIYPQKLLTTYSSPRTFLKAWDFLYLFNAPLLKELCNLSEVAQQPNYTRACEWTTRIPERGTPRDICHAALPLLRRKQL
ncbi:hypothetical protein B0J14DRAFT_609752 [Halenospora varia]|nr:hypothetical protein B0J14DRAFT_609752 [Halenospora varia]